ncbi:MAG: DUF3631 domain-containing protein [Acidobacteriales bacterium]|nr:DUF3631 domain-containing protein [Terriglobales bacterium]
MTLARHAQKSNGSAELGLPHSVATERSLLGAVLSDRRTPNRLLKIVAERLTADDFSVGAHRIIFGTMRDMGDQERAIDLVTLTEELRQRDKLEPIGGAAFVSELTNGAIRASNVAGYAAIIKKLSRLRAAIHAANTIVEAALRRDADPDTIARLFEDEGQRLATESAGSEEGSDPQEVAIKLTQLVGRFVALSPAQLVAVILWTFHTHAFVVAEATPYLAINSAEKQSGKTRLLELLDLLVARPWYTGRISAAVLIRKVDAERPTLLLDESDAAFNGPKEYAEALRGILNSGHRRGGRASLCVARNREITYRDFNCFCPKAIAGIGSLPDTLADRSIPIRLKRQARHERVARFNRRDVEPEARELRQQLAGWARGYVACPGRTQPALPEELTDRQQDVVEPLLAIADAIGGEWPERARNALVDLYGGQAAEDRSIGVRLLRDIRQIFEERRVGRISSTDLCVALARIETSPWSELLRGERITPVRLARLLGRFEIQPEILRQGQRVFRGYKIERFHDTFSRYLPFPSRAKEGSGALQAASNVTEAKTLDTLQRPHVTSAESGELPLPERQVTHVTVARS